MGGALARTLELDTYLPPVVVVSLGLLGNDASFSAPSVSGTLTSSVWGVLSVGQEMSPTRKFQGRKPEFRVQWLCSMCSSDVW